MKENYVDYLGNAVLANCPHMEWIGEHSLFTDAGRPVILSKVRKALPP